MARVPEGADLIPNRMSGAPGIRIGNVHLMAGVPHIAAQMLDALTGTLEGGAPLLSETVGGWIKESEVADILREVERAHDGCQIGSYPFFRDGEVGANFVIRSTDPDALRSCVDSAVRSARRGGVRLHAGRGLTWTPRAASAGPKTPSARPGLDPIAGAPATIAWRLLGLAARRERVYPKWATSIASSRRSSGRTSPATSSIARKQGEVWMRCGALDYRECVADDLALGHRDLLPAQRAARGGRSVVCRGPLTARARIATRCVALARDDPWNALFEHGDMPFDTRPGVLRRLRGNARVSRHQRSRREIAGAPRTSG